MKWSGKYEILMKNLIEKYGPLGSPTTLKADSSTFQSLIAKATPTLPQRDSSLNVMETKVSNSINGLETSTFTVCTRVRPLLGSEVTENGSYATVVPGQRTNTTGRNGNLTYTEELLLHTPKVSITGKAKLETSKKEFDYVFGPQSTNEQIYELTCDPLLKRALNGQVGVIFAYGQTGSGKTHTMSGILDILCQRISEDVFLFSHNENESTLTDQQVTFSYIEMLGRDIKDCLPGDSDELNNSSTDPDPIKEMTVKPLPVQIGEGLNGSVLIRNMKIHTISNASQLSALITKANATRATAATAKNETSSRSHGVAIFKVMNRKTKVEGTLYVIDLAGSESAKDSKDHDKIRMKETKDINLSLMTLKQCIRARTNASMSRVDIDNSNDIHVPYRRNKLTLLMKDVFDIGCSRLCSTVIIAHCSPLVSDIKHSKNTVKYAAPLRVVTTASNSTGDCQNNLELDVHDPALWSNTQFVRWVEGVITATEIRMDASLFVNGLTGVQFCALSENEFYARAEAQLGDTDDMMKIAKKLYLGMWTLIVDAKTRKRRADGSIITVEQEIEERRQLEERTLEKARIWAEREKYL
jgi:kinesin family protein 2/24